jgi:hypothetical protein
MRGRLLVVFFTLVLVATWSNLGGAAGPMPYSLEKAERGFHDPPKGPASPTAVAADAIIGRPVGLLTTALGTGVFVLTLPFTVPSGSVREASWGLVGQPYGWTFRRALGRNDPQYDRPGVFK